MIYRQVNQLGKKPFVYSCIDLAAFPFYNDSYVLGDAQLVKLCRIPGIHIDTKHLEVMSDNVYTHKKILRIIKVDSKQLL